MATLLIHIEVKKRLDEEDAEERSDEDKYEYILACEGIARAEGTYNLTREETASLSEDDASVERLQAILIKEHNEVSGASSGMSQMQIVKHMRAQLLKDERTRADDDEGLIMSAVRKKQFLAYTGYIGSRVYTVLKLAQLNDENYDLLLQVHDAHCGSMLQGQKKRKKGDDNPDAESLKMEFTGLKRLVANVDEPTMKEVLEELIACKRTLRSVTAYTTNWMPNNSKYLFRLTNDGVGYAQHTFVL